MTSDWNGLPKMQEDDVDQECPAFENRVDEFLLDAKEKEEAKKAGPSTEMSLASQKEATKKVMMAIDNAMVKGFGFGLSAYMP